MDGEPQPPPERIAVLVGDCLYDFRCALDHLAWELVKVSGGKPDNRVMFPIFTDAGKFSQGFRRIDQMSTDILALIVLRQPCYGWNPHRNRMLAALECLVNIDKHRHLHVISAATDGAFWNPGSPVADTVRIFEGPVHDGTELGRFPPDDVKLQFFPAIGVAFAEDALPSNGSALQILMGIDDVTCPRQRFFPSAESFPRPGS